MRSSLIVAVTLASLTVPALAIAAMYSVAGNKPQSASNYKRWDGLVDVVNQPTRRMLVWVNGAESFSYTGDTEELNATLKLFAKIKCPTHQVVLRPGPLAGKYDWQMHIVEGIVRAWIEMEKLEPVRDLDPVLMIYVSNKIDLDEIVIPKDVKVLQLSDLRTRYETAKKDGSKKVKSEADRYLKAVNEDPVLKSLGKAKYEVQLKRIETFVRKLPKRSRS